MAANADAPVIVEASDGSGSLHQASERVRLRRQLFIPELVGGNTEVTSPTGYLGEMVGVIDRTCDVFSVLKKTGFWPLAHAGGLATG